MRKLMLLVLVIGLVAGGLALQRYIGAESSARELRSRVKNFPSLLQGKATEGPVSSYQVAQIVQNMAKEVDGVTIREDQIQVLAVPVEVGEGKTSCNPPPYPPELKKLSTLDQGNVKNLALRCDRGLHLIGFRAKARGPSGDRFDLEGWSYLRQWGG